MEKFRDQEHMLYSATQRLQQAQRKFQELQHNSDSSADPKEVCLHF
jgi:hypothetical protein